MALKSLGKRVAKAEIAILEADKGKRFVVVDMDTYVSMAMDHTKKDVEVTREELHTHQRILSSTAKAMVNALGTGVDQSHRNYVRCVNNAGSEAEDPPVMKVLPKVHKGLMPQGHPHSRPVVNAASGMSSRAGDVVSDFLEPLVLLLCPRMEDRSTEEAIHQLEEAEEGMRKSGSNNAMVGSLDVAALYPSIDQEQAADMVAMTIQESPIRMEGINLRCLQVYLSSNLTEKQVIKEGLKDLVPGRARKGGKRPGPTTDELGKKHVDPRLVDTKEQDSMWAATNPEEDLSEPEKRLLLAKAIKIAIITVFKNHVYQFGGRKFQQTSGGPIGLRLTSLVARIVMDRWALSFLGKVDRAGMKVWAMIKYVDDVNIVVDMLDTTVQWDGDNLVDSSRHTTRLSYNHKDSSNRSSRMDREIHTMNLVRQAANSIHCWLKFTADLPGDHETNMVPMLDMQVWVDRTQEVDVLSWIFYEKSTASVRVLKATSAYTW